MGTMIKKRGLIQTWMTERGFGFIHSLEDGEVKKYFCHISEVMGTPHTGDACLFVPEDNKKGPQAIHVEIITAPTSDALNVLSGVKS